MRKSAIILVWASSLAVALCSDVKRDERIVFFPTIGQWMQDEAVWKLDIHGSIYEPESRRTLAAAIRRALGIEEDKLTPAEKATVTERIKLFLVDKERSKKVSIRVGEKLHKLGTSSANGHFNAALELGADELKRMTPETRRHDAIVRFQVEANPRRFRHEGGEVHLIGETGLSVISDIDDTIKVSEVRDRKAMIRNTFVRPFQPVPGMAEVYQSWAKSAGASFHYVSASPWQLYLPLSEFTHRNGFPAGTWHMKMFRVKDRSAFVLFTSPEQYKPEVIGSLLKRFPQRRFVLVGDSGEKDPEIYGDLARKHRQQVTRILIRDVTGESSDSVRYEKAFKDLPPPLWQVFKESAEIESSLRRQE